MAEKTPDNIYASDEELAAALAIAYGSESVANIPTPSTPTVVDGDTLRAADGRTASDRLNNPTGGSFDAFETAKTGGITNNPKTMARQREAIEIINRWEPGTATDEDVLRLGDEGTKRLQDFIDKGGVRSDSGEEGFYGRNLVDVVSPDGVSFTEANNTPEFNAAYYSARNAKTRLELEAKAAEKKAAVDRKMGRVTDAELDTVTGRALQLGAQVKSGVIETARKVATAPQSIVQTAAVASVSDEGKAMYQSIVDAEKAGQTLTPEQEAFKVPSKTAQALALDTGTGFNFENMDAVRKLGKAAGQEGISAYEKLKGAEAIAKSTEEVQKFADQYGKDRVNKSEAEDQQADLKGKSTQAGREWDKGNYFQAGLTLARGVVQAGTDHPGASVGLALESAPEMVASIFALPVAFLANFADRSNKGIGDFQKEHKKLPDQAESAIIMGTAAVASAIDAGAAHVVGAPLKPAAIVKSLPADAKKQLSIGAKLLKSKPSKIVAGVAAAAGSEFMEEGITNLLEQYAGKQDMSKLDFVEAYQSAGAGATAGAATRATLETGSVAGVIGDTATGTVQAIGKAAQKGADVTAPQVTKDLVEATDSTNYTPEELPKQRNDIVRGINTLNEQIIEAHESGDTKTVDRLIVEHAKYSDALAGLQKAEEEKAVENVSKATPEAEPTQLAKDLSKVVTLGSKAKPAIEKVVELAKDSKDPQVKQVAEAVTDFVEKQETFKKGLGGKNVAEVQAEILGDKVNSQGQLGVGGHVNAINAAIDVGDKAAAKASLAKLTEFRDGMVKKYEPIQEAIKTAEETKEDVTVPLGAGEFTVYGSKLGKPDGNGVKKPIGILQAKRLIKTRQDQEIAMIDSGVKAMSALIDTAFGEPVVNVVPKATTTTTEESKVALADALEHRAKSIRTNSAFSDTPKDSSVTETTVAEPTVDDSRAATIAEIDVLLEQSTLATRTRENARKTIRAKDVTDAKLAQIKSYVESKVEADPVIDTTTEEDADAQAEADYEADVLTQYEASQTVAEVEAETRTEPVRGDFTDPKEKRKQAATDTFTETFLGKNRFDPTIGTHPKNRTDGDTIRNRIGKTVDVLEPKKEGGTGPMSRTLTPMKLLSGAKKEDKRITKGAKQFIKDLHEVVGKVDVKKVFLTDNLDRPLHRFRDVKTHQLPDNMAEIATVVAHKYLNGRLQDSLNVNYGKRMNDLVGQGEDYTVPTSLATILGDVGVLRNSMAANIGKDVLAGMNLTTSDKADGNLQLRMEMAVGEVVLATLAKQGKVEFVDVLHKDLEPFFGEEQTADFAGAAATNTDGGKVVSFVRVTNERFDDSRRAEAREEVARIDELLTDERTTVMPSHKKPKKPKKPRIMKGTGVEVSEAVSKGVDANEQIPYTPKRNMMNLLNRLDPDRFKVSLGYVEDIDALHITERNGAEGKNQAIERAIDSIRDYMAHREQELGKDNYSSPMYFKQEVFKTLRHSVKGSIINPVGTKLHRHWFGAKDWFATVSTTHNDGSLDNATIAIAEGLGFSVGTRTVADFNSEIYDTVTQEWRGTPKADIFRAAVEALNSKSDTFTNDESDAIFKAIDTAGEVELSWDALVSFAELVEAMESGKKSVTLNLGREVDGTTNGVISGMLQLPGINIEAVKEFLRRGGIFFKGDTLTSADEWLETDGNNDNYQTEAMLTDEYLQDNFGTQNSEVNALAEFIGPLTEIAHDELPDGSVVKRVKATSAGRKFGKVPLMITAYSAGIGKIKSDIAEFVVANMYKKLVKAAKEIENVKYSGKSTDVDEAIHDFDKVVANIEMLAGKIEITPQTVLDFEFTPSQIKAIAKKSDDTYGAAVEYSLDQLLGDFTDNRSYINQGMRVVAEIFVHNYNKAVNKAVEKKGGLALNRKEEEVILKEFIDKGEVPGFMHATSKGHADSIQITETRKEPVSQEDGGKVDVRYGSKVPVTMRNADGTDTKGTERVSRSATISKQVMDSDIGVKGNLGGPIATDGNTNAAILVNNDVLNVFDAILGNINKINDQALEINEIYHTMHQHSQIDAVVDKYNIAIEAAKKLPLEEKRELFAKLNDVMRNIGTGDNVQKFKGDFTSFNKAFQGQMAKVSDRSKQLRSEIIVNEQYKNYGSGFVVQDDAIDPARPMFDTDDLMIIKDGATQVKGIGPAKHKAIVEYLNSNTLESLDQLTEVKGITQAHVDSLAEIITLRSGEHFLDPNDFIGSEAVSITPANIAAIAEEMKNKGNKTDSKEHTDHLTDILTGPVSATIAMSSAVTMKERVAGTDSIGEATLNDASVLVQHAQDSVAVHPRMSSLEVFTHEMVHIMWNQGLKNSSSMKHYIKRAHTAARIALAKKYGKGEEYKMFLPRDANGEPQFFYDEEAETQTAKDMYKHIFEGKDYIQEFATAVLTNETLRNELAGINVSTARGTKSKSVIEHMKRMFELLVEAINRRMAKAGNRKGVVDSIDTMALAVSSVADKNQHWGRTLRAKRQVLNDKVAKAAGNYVVGPYSRWVDRQVADKNKGRVKKVVTAVAGAPKFAVSPEFRKETTKFLRKMGVTSSHEVLKWVSELQGATPSTIPWMRLLRREKRNDADRERLRLETKRLMDSKFHSKVTDDDMRAAHQSIVKTEMHLLAEIHSPEALIEMLGDDKLIAKEAAKIMEILKREFPEYAPHYAKQAESLGHFMATGEAGTANQMLNGYNIVRLMALGEGKTVKGDLDVAESLVEQMAALYAIKYTAKHSRAVTARLMKAEYAADPSSNGIDQMMQVHRLFKEKSLTTLFNGDKRTTILGYTIENLDPLASFEVADVSDEERMRVRGFRLHGTIKKDDGHKLAGTPALFVSYHGLNHERQSGITTLQNRSAKGTKIFNTLDLGKEETRIDRKSKELKGIRDHANKVMSLELTDKAAPLDFTKNYAIPSMGPNGIHDYRYMMKESTKQESLRMDNKATESLASMMASIAGKHERKNMDKLIVEQAKADFDREFSKDPAAFVKLSAQSKDPKHEELWVMMSSDMKEDIKEVWGDEGMYIKEELLDLVYGFKKLSITDKVAALTGNDGGEGNVITPVVHAMRHASLIWRAIVARGKTNVVIFTPAVLAGNVMSNYMTSVVALGMGPVQTTKLQAEALSEIRIYTDVQREVAQLELELETNPKMEGVAEAKKKLVRLKADLENNSVHPLVQAGAFSTIVEDVDEQSEQLLDAVANAMPLLGRGAEAVGKAVPDFAKTVYDHAMLKRNTAIGKEVFDATTYSDFVARYAAFKYLTEEKGERADLAIEKVMDAFVSYDANTSPFLQYLNDVGLLQFTKFLIRIQRVIFRMFKEQPFNAISAEIAQRTLGDMPDILDAILPSKMHLERFTSISENLENAFQVPMLSVINP